MEKESNSNNKIPSNNNNILLEIEKDLKAIILCSNDKTITAGLENLIKKVENFMKENKQKEEIKNALTEKEIIYDVGKYIGQSKNGLKEGKGIFLYESGPSKDDRYEGFWGNNKREGYGVYIFSNHNRYEGDWKNGKKEGKGIFYFNSGERYEGDFKNGNFEGKGVFYFNSGNRYEGDFKNDKKDGHGIFYYKNGDRRMGDYSNDEPIGKHIILTKIGNVRTEYYEM